MSDTSPILTYSRYGCHHFALAAHRMLGWPMHGAFVAGNEWRGASDAIHVFVTTPDGYRLDIFGLGDDLESYQEEISAQHPDPVCVLDLAVADVDALVALGWLSPFDQSDVADAERHVSRILVEEGIGLN